MDAPNQRAKGMMKTHRLGKSELEVSRIGLGCTADRTVATTFTVAGACGAEIPRDEVMPRFSTCYSRFRADQDA